MRRVIALLHPSYTVRGVGARQQRPSRRLAARHGTRNRGGQRDTPTPLGFRANLYRSWIGYEVGRGREGRWCRASPPTFHQRSTELILSFNGTYRGLSPPASFTANLTTRDQPQQGFHYRDANLNRISWTVGGGGGSRSKRLIREFGAW